MVSRIHERVVVSGVDTRHRGAADRGDGVVAAHAERVAVLFGAADADDVRCGDEEDDGWVGGGGFGAAGRGCRGGFVMEVVVFVSVLVSVGFQVGELDRNILDLIPVYEYPVWVV